MLKSLLWFLSRNLYILTWSDWLAELNKYQVIANMRVLMTEDSNSAVSNSFLLDDDSRFVQNLKIVPWFCISGICKSWLWNSHLFPRCMCDMKYGLYWRSFLVCCSIPFSVDDISKSMPEVDMAEVEPPPLLKDNPAFHFLMPQPEP